MTTNSTRKKRTATSNQERYETAIATDDTDTFVELIKSKEIVVASVAALKAASASQKNFYLREIKNHMNPEDLRRIANNNVNDDQLVITESSSNAAKKRKVSGSSPQNATVDKIVAEWPFKNCRVVFIDEFSVKKDEKPSSQPESKAKWQKLFAVSELFCTAAGLQQAIFDQIDQIACQNASSASEKLAGKLVNCRQSVRLCFTRLSFIPKMIFTVSSREQRTDATPKTCNFDQLLDLYSIPIPRASNFKGRGPIFATFFMQYLNTVVFDGTDSILTKIDYQQAENEDDEE